MCREEAGRDGAMSGELSRGWDRERGMSNCTACEITMYKYEEERSRQTVKRTPSIVISAPPLKAAMESALARGYQFQ